MIRTHSHAINLLLALSTGILAAPPAEDAKDQPQPVIVKAKYDGQPEPAPVGSTILFDGKDISAKTVRVSFTFPASASRGVFKLHWYPGHALPRPLELEADKTLPEGGALIRGSKATVLTNTHASSPQIIPELKMGELLGDAEASALIAEPPRAGWVV